MAWTNGTLTNSTAGEKYPEFGGESAGTAVYGKLLEKFKDFVCGKVTAPVFTGTGNGFIRSLEVTTSTTTKAWTLTFSSATAFDITASGETTVSGTLTGSAPNRYATVSGDRFTCRVYEGSTPFVATDNFTFSTTACALGAQAWEVISDTANGTGSGVGHSGNNAGSVVGEGSGSYTANVEMGDYLSILNVTLSGTATNRGTLGSIVMYAQSIINSGPYYVTFSSSGTVFTVRDSTGTQIGNTGTVAAGVAWEWGAAGSRLKLLVTGGSTAFTDTVSPTSTPPTGGNFFTISVKTSTAAAINSHLTRVVVLKSTGLAGADTMYYTLAQRVGGNRARFYLEMAISKTYSSSLPTWAQAYMSPVVRIRHAETGIGVPYYFVATGRHAYILTNIDSVSAPDPQAMGFGLLLPHATPTEHVWPAFVGGSVTDTNLSGPGSSASYPNGPFWNPIGSATRSTVYFAIPTTAITWGWGANYGIQAINVSTVKTDATTGVENEYTISPWDWSDINPTTLKFHSGVYGSLSMKAIFPSIIYTAGLTTVRGVLGEFPGLFFTGAEGGAALGDTLDTVGYVVWKASGAVTATDYPITAAFALE